MNTPYVHREQLVNAREQLTLPRRQARRRQLTGIALIIVGTAWLGLVISGAIGDLPSPGRWLIEQITTSTARAPQALLLMVLMAGCGMLATSIIHRVR